MRYSAADLISHLQVLDCQGRSDVGMLIVGIDDGCVLKSTLRPELRFARKQRDRQLYIVRAISLAEIQDS
jgi:hypothetical protein